MADFSAAWEVPCVWQTPVLLEEEHSPCLACRPKQWGFQLILQSINRQILLEKKGCVCLVSTLHPYPIVNGEKKYSPMSKSWTRTLESTSYLILNVPSWLGVIGTRARWLFKKSCLWDKSNCQAARGISWELIVIFWSRSFTGIVTDSGPKSRVYWIPSLETEKIMMILCTLAVSWL